MSIADQIHQCGWSLETEEFVNENRGTLDRCFRAQQGNYFTVWRDSPELVLKDLLEARKASGKAPPCPLGASDAPNHTQTPQNA